MRQVVHLGVSARAVVEFVTGCPPWVGDTHCDGVRPRLLIVSLGRASHSDLLPVAHFGVRVRTPAGFVTWYNVVSVSVARPVLRDFRSTILYLV